MANTYRKVYLHIVFAVKNREALLDKEWRDEVFKYISGVLKNKGHFPLAVNGYNNHIHILIDYNLGVLVSDIVREVKKSSTNFINKNNYTSSPFNWQVGYGVFSVGWREMSNVIQYIINQEEHHRKKTFKEEYISLLKENEIKFNNEYLFDFLEKKK